MKKINVIYWTSTGNTEIMAESIYEGIKNFRNEDIVVSLKNVSQATEEDIKDYDMIVLGSSAMSVESIDDSEMEPYLIKNKEFFENKEVALFGSYDWGDGEWLETWEDLMKSFNCQLSLNSLKLQNTPDQIGLKACLDFSNKIIQHLK